MVPITFDFLKSFGKKNFECKCETTITNISIIFVYKFKYFCKILLVIEYKCF